MSFTAAPPMSLAAYPTAVVRRALLYSPRPARHRNTRNMQSYPE